MDAEKRTKRLAGVFAANAKKMLKNREWKMSQLAAAMGVHQSKASRLLSGKHFPSGKSLVKVANVFGVKEWELICDPTDGKQKSK